MTTNYKKDLINILEMLANIEVGFLVGEINFDIQSGFILPPVNEVFDLTSPFSIDFPPSSYYLEVLPLVIIGYLLLFGDFVTGTEILKDAPSISKKAEHLALLALELVSLSLSHQA